MEIILFIIIWLLVGLCSTLMARISEDKPYEIWTYIFFTIAAPITLLYVIIAIILPKKL